MPKDHNVNRPPTTSPTECRASRAPRANRSDRLNPTRRSPLDHRQPAPPAPNRRGVLLGLGAALLIGGEAAASPGSLFGRATAGRRRAPEQPEARARPGASLWETPAQTGPARHPAPAPATPAAGSRRIAMVNAHTGERIDIEYMRRGRYLDAALAEIARFSRDWRENAVEPIDPKVIDIAHALWAQLGAEAPLTLLSGYRTQKTNRRLAGAARDSLHLQGKALDLSHPKHPTGRLISIAQSLGAGGVGAYRASGFVHVDSGPVRVWGV
jgi:uncharacterized protein YcbK (DUF882 family)